MKKTLLIALALLLACLPALGGCGKSGQKQTVVNFLNWGEYIDPAVLAEFNDANPDILVKMKNVTSNEEMYVVCATEGSQIDVVVPSDYMVERLMNEGLLAELDHSKLSNFKNVEEYSNTRTFDPESKYSVPYMWGALGIVYNTKLVDDPVDSWDILWNEKYSGKIMMYDSIRDSLAVSLIRLGYSQNSVTQSELDAAGEELIQQKPLVLAYGTDDIKESMVSGSAALAVDYSGAAAAAIMENPDISFVIPKEGSNVWVDNLVILKSSEKQEAALRFINYLLETEISARNSEYIGYTSPDKAAMALLSEELQNNAGLFLKDEDIARCEYYHDLGDALSLYNDVWMKVKS